MADLILWPALRYLPWRCVIPAAKTISLGHTLSWLSTLKAGGLNFWIVLQCCDFSPAVVWPTRLSPWDAYNEKRDSSNQTKPCPEQLTEIIMMSTMMRFKPEMSTSFGVLLMKLRVILQASRIVSVRAAHNFRHSLVYISWTCFQYRDQSLSCQKHDSGISCVEAI